MASKWKVESESRSGLILYQNDADPNQCLNVYMMWDVMILMGEIHFEGHWMWWALKIPIFGPRIGNERTVFS
jgi:hypothetical protein